MRMTMPKKRSMFGMIGAGGLIFLLGVVWADGRREATQDQCIKSNKEKIEEHKDDVNATVIAIHKRFDEHEKEQKKEFKEVKNMLNSIYYKVK